VPVFFFSSKFCCCQSCLVLPTLLTERNTRVEEAPGTMSLDSGRPYGIQSKGEMVRGMIGIALQQQHSNGRNQKKLF
jgi:hypothetical protein